MRCPSVCLPVPYGMLTRKQKRRETAKGVNVPCGRNNRCANFQLKGERSTSWHVENARKWRVMWSKCLLAAGSQHTSWAQCSGRVTLVCSGHWTDGRIRVVARSGDNFACFCSSCTFPPRCMICIRFITPWSALRECSEA